MKQVRLKSVGDNQYLDFTRGKWYDVVGGTIDRNHAYCRIIDDNNGSYYAMQYDGNWETREKPMEKTHEIKDSDLHSMYNDVREEEWKDRIRKAIPTFKPDDGWVDITKDCEYIQLDKRSPLDYEARSTWNSINFEWKMEDNRLWRRLK